MARGSSHVFPPSALYYSHDATSLSPCCEGERISCLRSPGMLHGVISFASPFPGWEDLGLLGSRRLTLPSIEKSNEQK